VNVRNSIKIWKGLPPAIRDSLFIEHVQKRRISLEEVQKKVERGLLERRKSVDDIIHVVERNLSVKPSYPAFLWGHRRWKDACSN